MHEVCLGAITLHTHQQLLANGVCIALGPTALHIISVLADANGQIVPKDELIEAIWPDSVVEENALHVHISALRKALGPEAHRFRTIRGVGYQLIAETAPTKTQPLADEPLAQPQPAGSQPAFLPGWVATAWAGIRRPRGVLVLAVTLMVLASAWSLLGPDRKPEPVRQVSLILHPLSASGTGDRIEVAMASGISEELTVRLRRIPGLQISMAGAAGATAEDESFAVEGSIRSSGNRIRVTTRLSNAAGRVLWMQSFDRPISDVFAIQEEIAAAIAAELSVSLDVGVDSTQYGGTSNPEAFAAYLQYMTHRLDQNQSIPRRYLERALQLDPKYVKALSGQAIWYGMQARRATNRAAGHALLAMMREETDRALAANPDLWIGHITQGWYHVYSKEFRLADASFERAADLDEGSDPELRGFLSSHALIMGRTRDSLALLASNTLIDPARRSDRSQVWALSQAGRHQEAIDLFESLAPVFQDSVAGNAFWAHLIVGGEAEAVAFAEEHIPSLAQSLSRFKADPALPTMSRAELEAWANGEYGEGGHLELAAAASFAGYSGHEDLAVELLRLSFHRVGATHSLFWNPVLASTRETEAFALLMTELGLADYWRESGNWPDFCRPVSATQIACQ